jgi:hypothetical protein
MEKVRNVPHVEGNFSTFFYIKIRRSKKLTAITDNIKIHLGEFQTSDIEEYHISLTKTFFLKYHEINNFIKDVKAKLTKVKQSILITSRIRYLQNEFNNRFFLGLEVYKSKNLVSLMNELTEKVKLFDPDYELFENYIPHISLLWSDKSFTNASPVEDLNQAVDKLFPQNVILKTIQIDHIYFKIGNRVYQI